MRFDKTPLVSLMATTLLALSAAAFADEPPTDTTQVNITAEVVDNTCEVDPSQAPWNLDKAKVDDIMRNGPTSHKIEIISLKNCGDGVRRVVVSTNNGIADADGNIANQSGETNAAKNVAAEILGPDNQTVLKPASSLTYNLTSGSNNNLTFNVRLKQFGNKKPTPGPYSSSVVLNLAYE